MRTHELKCWPTFYQLIVSGQTPFTIRRNDRGFQLGDCIFLQEYDTRKGYTGRESVWRIHYILTGYPGLVSDYCLLGLEGPWGMPHASEPYLDGSPRYPESSDGA